MSQSSPETRAPLAEEGLEAFAAELDDILRRASEALGEPDIRYLKSLVRTQRALETARPLPPAVRSVPAHRSGGSRHPSRCQDAGQP